MFKVFILNKNEAVVERTNGTLFALYSSEDVVKLGEEFVSPQTGYNCLSVCKSSAEDTQVLEIDVA